MEKQNNYNLVISINSKLDKRNYAKIVKITEIIEKQAL